MSEQRDGDSWEPAPALVKRINAAIGRWGIGGGDFYKQITEAYAEGCEELDDDEFWEIFSAEPLAGDELDRLEDRFVAILERAQGRIASALDKVSPPPVLELGRIPPRIMLKLPDDEPFPGGDHTHANSTVATWAIWGLMATASCRREIKAGRAAAAAWEMCIAMQLHHLISGFLGLVFSDPDFKARCAAEAHRDAGLKTIDKNRRRKTKDRVSFYRLLRARKVKKEQIPRECAREFKMKTEKAARRWLNENTSFAIDS
jgi:hypothetical protein